MADELDIYNALEDLLSSEWGTRTNVVYPNMNPVLTRKDSGGDDVSFTDSDSFLQVTILHLGAELLQMSVNPNSSRVNSYILRVNIWFLRDKGIATALGHLDTLDGIFNGQTVVDNTWNVTLSFDYSSYLIDERDDAYSVVVYDCPFRVYLN